MSDVGEKGFVRDLFDRYRHRTAFTAEPDDAAIVQHTGMPHVIALNIDRGPSAVASQFGLSSRIVDGRLAATACCSDLLAAWSRPRALMISITVPTDTATADVDAALDGFLEVCEENDVAYVGGDTKAGPWNLVACGVGDIETAPGRRHAAMPGDVIVICGEIGSFTGATLRAMNVAKSVTLSEAKAILCHPAARWNEANVLRAVLIPSAATDASDGLYEALLNLPSAGFGIRIDERLLPFSAVGRRVSEETCMPPRNLLYGGGDWNLVLAVPKDRVGVLTALPLTDRLQIAAVGEVISEPGFMMVAEDGRYGRLEGIVSDHFLGKIEDPVRYFERLRSYSGWADTS